MLDLADKLGCEEDEVVGGLNFVIECESFIGGFCEGLQGHGLWIELLLVSAFLDDIPNRVHPCFDIILLEPV